MAEDTPKDEQPKPVQQSAEREPVVPDIPLRTVVKSDREAEWRELREHRKDVIVPSKKDDE